MPEITPAENIEAVAREAAIAWARANAEIRDPQAFGERVARVYRAALNPAVSSTLPRASGETPPESSPLPGHSQCSSERP